MRKIGPCTILEKYGSNAYKVDLPTNMGLSPIFNLEDLVSYKGPIPKKGHDLLATMEDLKALNLPVTPKPKVEKILNSRVAKQTRTKTYMEYLVKWQGKADSEATWLQETEFKKLGINPDLIQSPGSLFFSFRGV